MTSLLGYTLPGRPPRGFAAFVRSARINLRVLGALMMREGLAKYGHENLGFFWVMGEPLFLTCGVMAMWTITGATHGHGVGIVPFALTGYSMLTLWRHLTGGAVHAMRHHVGLLFHRNVRSLDILLASGVLEIVGILTAFFIAWLPLMLLGVLEPLRDPLILVVGWLLQGWFSLAFAIAVAALSERVETLRQFVPPLLYITLPFTGAFYMVSWLPDNYQKVILWSPLVNTMEMFRYGVLPDIQTSWSIPYMLVVNTVLTAIALPLALWAQNLVEME